MTLYRLNLWSATWPEWVQSIARFGVLAVAIPVIAVLTITMALVWTAGLAWELLTLDLFRVKS